MNQPNDTVKIAWRFVFDDLKEEKKTYNTRLKRFIKDMDMITKKHKIFPRSDFYYVKNKEENKQIEYGEKETNQEN